MTNRHAKLIAKYALDWATTNRPWLRWEHRPVCSTEDSWVSLSTHPEWDQLHEYRRKKLSININSRAVPEPERDDLKHGTTYWYPNTGELAVYKDTWISDNIDARRLHAGLVHPTEEAAKMHLGALLSFTKLD